MNVWRIVLAALAGFVAYFVVGGLSAAAPALRSEFLRYSGVYRPLEGMKRVMPVGMAGMYLSILAMTVIYAMLATASPAYAHGALFGALIGLFTVGAFVLHNYVNLNIGWKLTVQQSIVYFVEWTIVGLVIGLIYKPVAAP